MARLLGISVAVLAVVVTAGCGTNASSSSKALVTGAHLTVSITTPSSPIVTSGVVHVEVEVAGGPAGKVKLLVDATPIATLTAPYQYEWDTAGTAEGEHLLVARACSRGACVESAPRTVTVDRTGPTIVARTPAPDAFNVWSRDPITVTFDEPLDPATVTSSAIQLVDQDDFALAIQEPELSPDGTTLRVAPVALPEVPNTLTLVLRSTITDRVGNRLAETLWRWALPEWQEPPAPGLQMGSAITAVYDLAAVVDGDGGVVIAFASGDARIPTAQLQVKQLRGSEWAESAAGLYAPGHLLLDVDPHDRLGVGWIGNIYPAPIDIHPRAFLWDGPVDTPRTAIVQPDAAPDEYSPAALRLDGAGGVAMAWCDGTNVLVSSWSAGAWGPISASADPSCTDVRLVGPGPLVAWRTEGGVCHGIPDGGTLTRTCFPLDVGVPAGAVLVPPGDPDAAIHVFAASTASGYQLRAEQYKCAAPLFCSPFTGTWRDVGAPFNVDPTLPVTAVRATLDQDGLPLVAWVEGGSALFVKRWDGHAWVPLGGSVRTDTEVVPPGEVVLAIGRTGVVAVVWESDDRPYSNQVFVKRYNR